MMSRDNDGMNKRSFRCRKTRWVKSRGRGIRMNGTKDVESEKGKELGRSSQRPSLKETRFGGL
jgi:hypothetical protein